MGNARTAVPFSTLALPELRQENNGHGNTRRFRADLEWLVLNPGLQSTVIIGGEGRGHEGCCELVGVLGERLLSFGSQSSWREKWLL